jgi:DNA-binding cell septation regulator SpoVG
MTATYPFNVVEQIDTKLDELEALLHKLPISTAVRSQIVDHIYKIYAEVETAVETTVVLV